MGTNRTHVVEGRRSELAEPVRALCGRQLMGRGACLGNAILGALGSMSSQDCGARHLRLLATTTDSTWITVAEFVLGGDDSPSCRACRSRLGAAIEREFAPPV